MFDSYSTAFAGQSAALKAVSAVMKAASGAAGAVLQGSNSTEINSASILILLLVKTTNIVNIVENINSKFKIFSSRF